MAVAQARATCYRPPALRRSHRSRARLAPVALAALGALLVAHAAAGGDSVGALRARNADLAAQSHTALLELYALDSQLDRARGDLGALQARAARVRAERAEAALRLAAARATLTHAQRDLGRNLRDLYEQDRPDPLAVLLGATSLEEVVAGFDGLSRSASATASVATQARTARRDVLELTATLAARQAQLD